MLLSDREEQQRMLRTEFCLEGEAKYDVNVLTVGDLLVLSIGKKNIRNSYNNFKVVHQLLFS